MSIRVMTAVFDHSRARLADRLVLLVIADRSDDDGAGCFRGKESIAAMARVSRSQVTRSIQHLRELGELEINERPGRSNQYRVTLLGPGPNRADPDPDPETSPGPEGADTRLPVEPTPGHTGSRESSSDTSTDPSANALQKIKKTGDPIEDRRRAQERIFAENEERERTALDVEKAPMPDTLRHSLRDPEPREATG